MSWQRRCIYINETGLQCETWFPFDESQMSERLCPAHRELITPSRAANNDVIKEKYIDQVNAVRAQVYQMSFDEIDAHIASLEKELEKVKTSLFTTRAVKNEKLEQLSEEERKKLRAIKVEKAIEAKRKEKTPSFVSDPIGFLMKKYPNMSEDQARELTKGLKNT